MSSLLLLFAIAILVTAVVARLAGDRGVQTVFTGVGLAFILISYVFRAFGL